MTSNLLLLVDSAFPETPFPDMTLREAELHDHIPDREITEREWDAARQDGRDVSWKQVPLDVLLNCETALSHISEIGFVYFMPAYILAALKHRTNPHPRTKDLLLSTVFHLTHTENNYSLSRLKAFSEAQSQAIIAFLNEVAKVADFTGREARKGLDTYWLTSKAKEPLIQVP